MPLEEYYQSQTKHILTSVVDVLIANPTKKFNWADIAFFNRWWTDQTEERQTRVKQLVADKQLVFIGGGWVMNDEALPSYKESMLQMRLGLDFLKDTFGVRPNIAWQIDPFGHSAVTVAVLHKLGYEAFVGNRISESFKSKLSNHDGFNFVWEGHQVSKTKEDSSLFTHIIQRHYNYPDTWSESSFYSQYSRSYRINVFNKEIAPTINAISHLSNNTSKAYHALLHAGDDFSYTHAKQYFNKVDELNKELENEGKERGYNTSAIYSTVYDYFEGIHSLNITYGLFKGDFLPFQEPFTGWEDFWTGYYSTRLHLKRFIRHVFNDIQGTKTLLAIRAIAKNGNSINFDSDLSKVIDGINNQIRYAERKWAILMHHDGITGTHMTSTENSYYVILNEALSYLNEARKLIESHLSVPISSESAEFLRSVYDHLTNPEMTQHTMVNPAGYYRIQIMNMTLPVSNGTNNYVFVMQTGDNVAVING